MQESETILNSAADGVGAVSTVLGGLLLVAPHTGGRWLGLSGTSVSRRRVLGAADLGLGLGITIIAGWSSSWRWSAVAVRSLPHLLFAREYLRSARRPAATAMGALVVIDAGIATGLRSGRRPV